MLKANYKGKFGCKRTKNVNACVCAHLPIDGVEQVVVTEQLSSKSKDSPCTSRTDSVCNDLNSPPLLPAQFNLPSVRSGANMRMCVYVKGSGSRN